MIENLQNSSKMLLTISNDSQQYDNFTTNFYPNYNGASQTYVQNYPSIQQNQTQYSYIQPNIRSVSQQNFPLLNVRTRRRRASHSVVATMDPAAVAKRNERERNRVKQVNDGFNELRQKIPYIPDKKKFSKVEILRFAMMYIRELQGVIGETSFDESKSETSASTNEYPGDESNMSDFQ